MTGCGDGDFLAAGGPARHDPVLRGEALAALAPRPHGIYVDGTFGAGGYTRAILSIPETRVIALDRDPSAVAEAQSFAATEPRLSVHQARFGQLIEILCESGVEAVEGVVLDIGVSSMQLDEGERGFSFQLDGPLDMRMSRSGATAADIVNEADETVLADILYHYGEERASRRIARAIVHDRRARPFTTTRPLAEMIARVAPGRPGDIHPATRSFQALRIAVNDELGELVQVLEGAEAVLKPGGRLAVVTFHSLEDRIVKRFLQARTGHGQAPSRPLPGEPALPPPTFATLGRQPVIPGAGETARNPRARSAKLRAAVRTEAPARGIDRELRRSAELPARRTR